MRVLIAAALIFIASAPAALFAETVTAMPGNKGFATVKEILDNNCATCHDWTGSHESITGGGRIVAGDPEKSILYTRIASDEMPADGPKLTPDQKAFIKGWIMAGAPATDLPISVPAAEGAAAAPASAAAGSLRVFHEVTGFTSTALLLGAGIIGAVHFIDMMTQGHILRDAIGFTEGSPDSLRVPLVTQAWGSDQALRWWHIGLLAAGETLYLGDALTGISMLTKPQPGKLTKRDIHRIAFYAHASLMAAQIALGFFTTDALSRGDHELVIGLGAAHATIGLAIPLVMLGAGLENLLLPE